MLRHHLNSINLLSPNLSLARFGPLDQLIETVLSNGISNEGEARLQLQAPRRS